MSTERNKLFREQNVLSRVDTELNIKGKKMKLYSDIRKGLSDERSALRALKKESEYDSDDSETAEIKQSIAQYKLALEDALRGLEESRSADVVVEEVEVLPAPTSGENNDGEGNDVLEDSPRSDDGNGSPYESETNELAI